MSHQLFLSFSDVCVNLNDFFLSPIYGTKLGVIPCIEYPFDFLVIKMHRYRVSRSFTHLRWERTGATFRYCIAYLNRGRSIKENRDQTVAFNYSNKS